MDGAKKGAALYRGTITRASKVLRVPYKMGAHAFDCASILMHPQARCDAFASLRCHDCAEGPTHSHANHNQVNQVWHGDPDVDASTRRQTHGRWRENGNTWSSRTVPRYP